MRLFFIGIFMCLLLVACGGKVSRHYVHLIPDSTLTLEQSALKSRLGKMIVKHVVIENNRFVLTASRKEFVKERIPILYYKLLKKNMKENNSFIEKNGIVDIEPMYDETIRHLKLVLGDED